MLRIPAIIAACALFLTACGSASEDDYADDVPTQSPPTITSVTPASGSAGDAITITGFGFSSAATNNIVIIGGSGVAATNYSLITPPTQNAIESLTAAVPASAATGQSSVVVVVYENASNADIMFTVNP